MEISRPIALQKLTDYLNKKMTKDEVYEWALGAVVDDKFESLEETDLLLFRSVKALVDINRSSGSVPTRKALEYYRRCLNGELEYLPLEQRSDLDDLGIEVEMDSEEEAISPKVRPASTGFPYQMMWILMRIYVMFFAVCSLGVHGYSIYAPEFLRYDDTIPDRWDSLMESLPHLLYGLLLLMRPRFLARPALYMVSLVLLVTGTLYYGSIAFGLVAKMHLHWLFILAILPFSAVPAALAILLLLAAHKKRTSVKTP